ncbi:ferrous iron transporter B [Euryarchaeota archaeon ex4484_162]|nr:MAG: ferrous iron transporter B [Euryarchaeota archaeon ex4484_162]RLF60542.1 MAG: ferrous iron transporter B [Thermoplasmata archaeon]
MKKIILMGSPNVGKSVIFSRLTGANVIASNYPGTTVDFSKGSMRLDGKKYEIIDAPGTYSLTPTNKAEEVALKIFKKGDIIINVVDATNLERNLYLTLEILEKKKPTIVALNLWDEAQHTGITIDVKKLEEILGVPVVPTTALTGEGIKELISRLKEAKISKTRATSEKEKWVKIGKIIKSVEKVEHRHHTIRETIADATIKPATGIPLAFLIIIVSFWVVRFIGETLVNYIFDPIFELYKPVALQISHLLGPGILHDIIIGKLVNGDISFMESMGLLTTGIYVPFAAVLPYIIAFYLILSILEDSGYLPRLATLVDNVFHKLGMHGHSIVTVFLGLGCNVPGALSTRILETRKQRFISATLLAISVPCMAQTAMVFGILGRYGLQYILMVFLTLMILYLLMGLLLNKIIQGESPEIFLEIPPYRRPSLLATLKKTWMRVRWFLKDAIPWLFLGVVLVNILYSIGFIDWIGNLFAPVIEGILGLSKGATTALLVGFLRKDLAVGMLLPLNMTPYQLVIAATILTIYFPCVATFTVLLKELGLKDMIKSTVIMILTALTVGGILRLILIGW